MKADTLRNILRVVVNFYNIILGGGELHNLTTSLIIIIPVFRQLELKGNLSISFLAMRMPTILFVSMSVYP